MPKDYSYIPIGPAPLTIWLITTLAILSSCDSAVPDGRIRIKNDIQDSSYNIISVSGAGSFSLKPGESKLLSKGSTYFSLSRRYKDYTRNYTIRCPSHINTGITIKMIDAHLNRMAGGCETVSTNQG